MNATTNTAAAAAMVDPSQAWTYQRCQLVAVVDGDTIDLSIDTGFGNVRPRERVRLYGLNAPEHDTAGGAAARVRLVTLLAGGRPITLTTIKDKREKYGRMLGLIVCAGVNVNQRLIEEGLAKPWDGHGVRPV